MSKTTWSVQDAKNRFSEVITAARKSPQTVTKHGKPAVVVVDADEYARITKKRTGKTKTIIDHLFEMPKDDGAFERASVTYRDIDL